MASGRDRAELDARARQGETVVPGGTGGRSLEAQEHLAEGLVSQNIILQLAPVIKKCFFYYIFMNYLVVWVFDFWVIEGGAEEDKQERSSWGEKDTGKWARRVG